MTEIKLRINQAQRVLDKLKSVRECGNVYNYSEAVGYAESGVLGLLAFLKELEVTDTLVLSGDETAG